MKSLVIGGQGFIGAEIVRALLAAGYDVTVADKAASTSSCDLLFGSGNVAVKCADILDSDAMQRITKNMDSVYHLAGKLGTSELDSEVVAGIKINIIGAVNVFEACVANEVPVVFYPSKPNVWLNTYTITKVASEQFAQLYSGFGTTRICSLRYFNAYGPWQAGGPVRKIIPAFARSAMNGLPIEIFGDGEQVIDMIYSPDIGRITVDFCQKSRSIVPMDCGRGVPLTVNEVADAVNAYFANSAATNYLPMRRGETPGTCLVADIAPLQDLLGDLRFTSWESSLATTLEWYARHSTFALRDVS